MTPHPPGRTHHTHKCFNPSDLPQSWTFFFFFVYLAELVLLRDLDKIYNLISHNRKLPFNKLRQKNIIDLSSVRLNCKWVRFNIHQGLQVKKGK